MLTLAPIFQDHAVLQRDQPIPLWGHARPGDKIHARLSDFLPASTTANDDGSWLLRLPAVAAGGPFTLRITAETGESVALTDILVGDVWVCSGQSNMEWKLSQCDADSTQSAGADYPHIRLLTIATNAQADPQTAVGGRWLPCTPDTISAFSAVGGWFGRFLHSELRIPIGLIANAWGGTRIEAWLSREALMTDPDGPAEVTAYEALLYGHRAIPPGGPYPSADEWFQAEGPENPLNQGEANGWHLPEFNDASWPEMDIPCRWQDRGHDFNGIFWFRRTLPLPPALRSRPLLLQLGAIDKHDQSYVNGVQIGGINWENRDSWCTPRSYTVPPELTGGETLTIAVRARSHLYHGGMIGPANAMRLTPADAPDPSLALTGPWRYAIEQNWGIITPPATFSNNGPGGQNAPYTLFNTRLHPVIPYGIRGFTWYQGESNAANAAAYRRQLPLMIHDWRRVFGQGDLPFLIVQLANYMAAHDEPTESDWAELREAQRAALALPATGLAVAIDVGDANDIHPIAKQPVGFRLARWALAKVYGRPVLPSGPLFRTLQPEPGGRLRVTFDYADGLHTLDGQPVRHVAIAPAQGPYRWAETALDGDTLLAWHPDIPEPHRLRYAWADNPAGCNLINRDDLPASPFQASL